MKKFYAVKQGLKTGIFENWGECQSQVKNVKGAKFKSFLKREDAENYINDIKPSVVEDKDSVVAYVDGSYKNHEFSCGVVIFFMEQEFTYSCKYSDQDLVTMRNVAGEIKGSEYAMKFALDNNAKNLIIYHDYEGINAWCMGDWKTNKKGTIAYKMLYDQIKKSVNIEFRKVLAHSGNKYNEMADKLAKKALGI